MEKHGKIVRTFNQFVDKPCFFIVKPDFQVPVTLPNISFPLSRSFAGNIPVNRQNHPNDTLFFWGFETVNGSLTRDAKDGDTESVSFSVLSNKIA